MKTANMFICVNVCQILKFIIFFSKFENDFLRLDNTKSYLSINFMWEILEDLLQGSLFLINEEKFTRFIINEQLINVCYLV